MATRGVPAHVTILHPFRAIVDETTADGARRIAADFHAFDVTFGHVGRFPGEVVYLAPEPSERFSAMTARFTERFSECPPYEGAFGNPIPHLTVGSDLAARTADVVEASVAPNLPIRTTVERLTLLMEDDGGMWSVGQSWPLLDRSAAPR